MQSINEELISKSAQFGADDTAFVHSGEKPLSCAVVMFFKYFKPMQPQPGHMALSPYYIASNRGYHAAKKLQKYIIEAGFGAEHDTMRSAKQYALKSGGFIGRNGFYYHESFGSLVSIQVVFTDAVQPDDDVFGENRCTACGACEAACPSGAVADITECLRYHSNLTVPEHLRGGLYQMLGCELCQYACPLNSKQEQQPVQFKTLELLGGLHLEELQELAGKNMARKQRILSQAALYSANTMQKDTVHLLKELSQSAPAPVCEHAVWALQKIEDNK